MYPNLFIIGAAKSGTTSLHYYLDQHPEVHMSREKEPAYFAAVGDVAQRRGVITDPRRYQAQFDSSLPVRGEASVTYSFWPYPTGVPERIKAVAPDARFIYLVRDPVERLLSHYRHRIVLGEETRQIADVAAVPDEARERYVAASSYASQLEQYLLHFEPERVLVVDHAELRIDRELVLSRCFEHVGVDPDFTSAQWDRRLNETNGQRQYSELAERLRHSRPYRKTIGLFSPEVRSALLSPARRLLTRQVHVEERVDDAVRDHFIERLAPEAARFRSMTGLPFADWSV